MRAFRYNPAIIREFPTIVGGVIIAQPVTNGPTPPALQTAFQEEQQATLARIGDTALADLPSIQAWRRVFSSFGVAPTKYRNAAEALLRRLTKKGDIPSINTLVDLGNLVSIRYGLPVAVFDTRHLTGDMTVRFATGQERFTDLGSDAVTHPEAGEVVFVDDDDLVIARRWCWRQADQSASRPDTTQVLVTVEGHHETATQDVAAALDDLKTLLAEYAGSYGQAALLSASQPALKVKG